MHDILLVEDQKEVHDQVSKSLGDGFRVTSALSIGDAKRHLSLKNFHLIVLDISLPDGDGFQFCAALRNDDRTRKVPIIFLTGPLDVPDKVMGFSLGEEDYVTKPFEATEFRARVEARVKRAKEEVAAAEVIEKEGLRLDTKLLRLQILQAGGRTSDVETTPQEFKLLRFLAEHENEVFSREKLISSVWGQGVHVTEHTIDTHVSKIRKKISLSGWTVQCLRGEGYRFIRRPQ